MRVARQALSPMPELLSYWLPLEDGKALIRYLNEQIAEMVALAPQRFVGLGAVPLQDVDSFGSSQICIGSDYPFNMGDNDPVATLGKAGLDAATVAAIQSTNARRFLGL